PAPTRPTNKKLLASGTVAALTTRSISPDIDVSSANDMPDASAGNVPLRANPDGLIRDPEYLISFQRSFAFAERKLPAVVSVTASKVGLPESLENVRSVTP